MILVIGARGTSAVRFAVEARKAGVEHIVLLSSNSVLFPDALHHPTAAANMRVEETPTASRINTTFVRPGYLATNTPRWRHSIRTARTAFPEGSTPLVHERDAADVVAAALLDDSHRGRAHLVLGGADLTERPVTVEVLDVDAYRAEQPARVPALFVEPIRASAGDAPQEPAELRVDAVPEVLGRAPLTFAEWTLDHVADFR